MFLKLLGARASLLVTKGIATRSKDATYVCFASGSFPVARITNIVSDSERFGSFYQTVPKSLASLLQPLQDEVVLETLKMQEVRHYKALPWCHLSKQKSLYTIAILKIHELHVFYPIPMQRTYDANSHTIPSSNQ